jgi:omega-amidase
MKENLIVSLVQFAPQWENKNGNLAYCHQLLSSIGPTDLVVLPEMFTTGFSMNVELLAEPMDGPTVRWMQEKAAKMNAAITGSTIIREDGKYFNRLLWITPDGQVQWYDKRHLFAIGDEHLHYTAGDQRVTFTWLGWRIRTLICYDLRFPVWSRNHDDYDLLLYVANWPSARHHVWKNLLISRALENQCYCVAVNRTGSDGMGLRYLGDSGFIDPRGTPDWLNETEGVKNFTLSYTSLHNFREKFPILRDRDEFTIP